MSNFKLNLFWIVILGATMPLAVVVSTHLARRSFEKVKLRDQVISVKGYAEQSITADFADWNATITARDLQLASAYARLEADRIKMMRYLDSKGFPALKVELSPVDISILHPRDEKGNPTNMIEGYVVSQRLRISSENVSLISQTAREASNFIKDGMELSSGSPQYLYTKLDQMKIQMLGQATQNARQRAEQLISHSASRLGALRSASQGVFQITPARSTEVSDSGVNDTSTIDKTIKAVVTLEYAIE